MSKTIFIVISVICLLEISGAEPQYFTKPVTTRRPPPPATTKKPTFPPSTGDSGNNSGESSGPGSDSSGSNSGQGSSCMDCLKNCDYDSIVDSTKEECANRCRQGCKIVFNGKSLDDKTAQEDCYNKCYKVSDCSSIGLNETCMNDCAGDYATEFCSGTICDWCRTTEGHNRDVPACHRKIIHECYDPSTNNYKNAKAEITQFCKDTCSGAKKPELSQSTCSGRTCHFCLKSGQELHGCYGRSIKNNCP